MGFANAAGHSNRTLVFCSLKRKSRIVRHLMRDFCLTYMVGTVFDENGEGRY